MRVLLVANPGLGHILPLLPLGHALRDAGHEVVVLGGASLDPVVTRGGFAFRPAGPPDLRSVIDSVPEARGLTGPRHAARIWERGFGGVVAPAIAGAILELAAVFRPDLVIHDDSEQGSWIAAEHLGIPHVALQATAWRSAGLRLSARPLGDLRRSLGLEDDPALARWHRNGFLATRPPALVDPADPPPATAVPMAPAALDEAGDDGAEPLLPPPAGHARVGVTMGTVLPGRAEALRAVIGALAGPGVEVVAAVGGGLEPALVDPGLPGVRVVSYVPMSRLLPTCAALVFHGGSGTMLAALAAGVPMVILPQAADQHENGARCAAAGVGIVLAPSARSPDAVAGAVRAVTGESSQRRRARQVRSELLAMPAPAALVPSLERLAAAGPGGVLEPAP